MNCNFLILTILLFSTASFLSAQSGPRIDQIVGLDPYQYIDSFQTPKKTLFLDQIFSGFNLSFDYSLNNSTELVSIPKNLTINRTLDFIPQNFTLVRTLVDSDPTKDAFAILYNESLTIITIQQDGTVSTNHSNYSSLNDIQCNDVLQPDYVRLILNCWNNTKNQGALGYLELDTLHFTFIDVESPVATDLARTGVRKIPKDTSLTFWRFYQGKEWVVEEWQIDPDTAITSLTRSFNYTHLNASWGITDLRELHLVDINLTILANATNTLALVNWYPATPDVLDIFYFEGKACYVTGAKLNIRSDMIVYIAEINEVYLQVFDLTSYQIENISALFSPELAETIYDYDIVGDHSVAIHSINAHSGKSYLSIATFSDTTTDADVIYLESPTIPVSGAIKVSIFSKGNTPRFYHLNDTNLTYMSYKKPILAINSTITPQISNVITLQVTSSKLDQHISENFSILVYYYNNSFFMIDTSAMISPNQFISGVYPTPKTFTLNDLGIKTAAPLVLYISSLGFTIRDVEELREFKVIRTSDGVIARDPLNAYWVFEMNSQSSVYRCTDSLTYCASKGTLRWPSTQKRVEAITDGYPYIIMSYPSGNEIGDSAFSVSKVYEYSMYSIEEKYLGKTGAQQTSNCQSMKVKKVNNSSYLLCLDTDRYSGNTSLTIFYIDDLADIPLGVAVNSMRNISIPLEGFPQLDTSGFVGLRLELHDDLMFVMMESDFTLFCYNLSSLSYSSPNISTPIPLIEQHQALNLLGGAEETYLYINHIHKILIIACPGLGIFEEWLIFPDSQFGTVLQYHGQTLTYGEIFESEFAEFSKVSSPVSYSQTTNTLYMMTTSGDQNKLYVYHINSIEKNIQYMPRLARGVITSPQAYSQVQGVSAVSNDLNSDFLVAWGDTNTLYQFHSELQIILDTTSVNVTEIHEIYEIEILLLVANAFPSESRVLTFNFSLYYLEDPIEPVNTSGQYANKITLGETAIIWALKPDDYFYGGVIDLEMTTSDPSDMKNNALRLLKPIDDDDLCTISDTLPTTQLLGADIGADGFAYLLAQTTVLKINTTTIYLETEAPAIISNLPSPLPDDVTNFFVGPRGSWMQFYMPSNKTIQAYNLTATPQTQQLQQGISTDYNFTKYYQVAFFNRSFLALTLECGLAGGGADCSFETFISLWDLTANKRSSFLEFEDFSSAMGVSITKTTQIVTKLQPFKAQNQSGRILLLAAVTDVERDLYLLAVCLTDSSNKTLSSCYSNDLRQLITDYNISRYGADWSMVDIMSSTYDQTAFKWEVLLGNRIYNSYVIDITLFQGNNSCEFNVSYGINNYLPNTVNTKISWAEGIIAVERANEQSDNNLTSSDPHVLYYDTYSGDEFDVGNDYMLLKTMGVSKLRQNREIIVLDPSEHGGVLKFPLNITNHYEVLIRDFSSSYKVEFNVPREIKSTELTLKAKNYGSFGTVKIQLEKAPPQPSKTFAAVLIAIGLLVLSAVVGVLYYIYQKRAKARKKKLIQQLLEEEEPNAGEVNPLTVNDTNVTDPVTYHDANQA